MFHVKRWGLAAGIVLVLSAQPATAESCIPGTPGVGSEFCSVQVYPQGSLRLTADSKVEAVVWYFVGPDGRHCYVVKSPDLGSIAMSCQ